MSWLISSFRSDTLGYAVNHLVWFGYVWFMFDFLVADPRKLASAS